jgi:hypothetical protein
MVILRPSLLAQVVLPRQVGVKYCVRRGDEQHRQGFISVARVKFISKNAFDLRYTIMLYVPDSISVSFNDLSFKNINLRRRLTVGVVKTYITNRI